MKNAPVPLNILGNAFALVVALAKYLDFLTKPVKYKTEIYDFEYIIAASNRPGARLTKT